MKGVTVILIIFFSLICFMAYSLAGSGWAIGDKSDRLKILFYNGSKVAELYYSGGWNIRCFSRKYGNSSSKFEYLKTATKVAMTECKK